MIDDLDDIDELDTIEGHYGCSGFPYSEDDFDEWLEKFLADV